MGPQSVNARQDMEKCELVDQPMTEVCHFVRLIRKMLNDSWCKNNISMMLARKNQLQTTISDSESEDGQISKQELEEEHLLSLGGYKKRSAKEEVVDISTTMVDLETCRLTRDLIVEHGVKPWFEDYVKGKFLLPDEFGIHGIQVLGSDI